MHTCWPPGAPACRPACRPVCKCAHLYPRACSRAKANNQARLACRPRSPPPRCSNLYDVFVNIRDDELEHVKTMVACQDGTVALDLQASPKAALPVNQSGPV